MKVEVTESTGKNEHGIGLFDDDKVIYHANELSEEDAEDIKKFCDEVLTTATEKSAVWEHGEGIKCFSDGEEFFCIFDNANTYGAEDFISSRKFEYEVTALICTTFVETALNEFLKRREV